MSAAPDLPHNQPREIINSLGMELVLIPAGTFLMGSPKMEKDRSDIEFQHEVAITKDFYLGKYQVTRGEFAQFVQVTEYRTEAEKDGEKNSWRQTRFGQTEEHPVVNVSWNDAKVFCAWLSNTEGDQYCLPTEAQWEYSCRAGSQSKFGFGHETKELDQYAWYRENSKGQTHPVGEKKPNTFGLHDTHGNVWEWCEDWYASA
jgi:formylglycine-generating enzyme required for sulfatase activity